MALDYDSWLLQGHDAGLDDGLMPCEFCGIPFEDHEDRDQGHRFELLHDDYEALKRKRWEDD